MRKYFRTWKELRRCMEPLAHVQSGGPGLFSEKEQGRKSQKGLARNAGPPLTSCDLPSHEVTYLRMPPQHLSLERGPTIVSTHALLQGEEGLN